MAYINLLLDQAFTLGIASIPINSTLYSHCSIFQGPMLEPPPFQDSLYQAPISSPTPEILQLKQKYDCIIPQLKVHQ